VQKSHFQKMKFPYQTLLMFNRNDIQQYDCKFTSVRPNLEKITGPVWEAANWTRDFIDIRGIEYPAPRFETKVKMLWDMEYLYFAAAITEPHIWTSITEKNSVLYWQNDFEIFIDPDGDSRNYYEFEVNALGTIWELTLDKPYNEGGRATHPTNIEGLISNVSIDGTINDASDVDKGWSLVVAIPWNGLEKYNTNRATPPVPNDEWRINFSRVEWQFKVVDGKYVRVPDENRWDVHYEDNWVWSAQKEINMHIPSKWGIVTFIP
jgi:hypothetical protein